MFIKKVAVFLAAALLAALLSGGCGWFKSKPPVSHLRYAVGAEPESLDPRMLTSIHSSTIAAQLFEGLITVDNNDQVVPAAAESWTVSPDGQKYTFYLRKNARWSNGDPVTAHDFEYAWKSTLSPELASSYAYQLFYLKNGEAYNQKRVEADQVGVRATGEHSLEVILERPVPYFLKLMAFHAYYPVNKKVAALNDKWAAEARTIVGNGPFKLTNWVHHNKLEFSKNEYYWDAAGVKMDKMEFMLVDSASTSLAMFENRLTDMGENPPIIEIPRLQRENKVRIYPYLGTYYYSFNVSKPPFDNPKVRKALTLAINRDLITRKVTQGGQKPALALVPYGLADIEPTADFRMAGGNYFKDNDVEEARKLLAEAGYPGGKGLAPITLLFNTSEGHKMIAEAVQEMWKKNLGVTVELSNQEWKVYVDNLDRRNFHVARDNWLGDYSDPMTFLEIFESTNGNNVPGYNNPEYDRLIKLAKESHDQAIRMKAMHDAEKLLLDDAPIAPIYFNTNTVMIRPYVKGFVRSMFGVIYFKEAYLEK